MSSNLTIYYLFDPRGLLRWYYSSRSDAPPWINLKFRKWKKCKSESALKFKEKLAVLLAIDIRHSKTHEKEDEKSSVTFLRRVCKLERRKLVL